MSPLATRLTPQLLSMADRFRSLRPKRATWSISAIEMFFFNSNGIQAASAEGGIIEMFFFNPNGIQATSP